MADSRARRRMPQVTKHDHLARLLRLLVGLLTTICGLVLAQLLMPYRTQALDYLNVPKNWTHRKEHLYYIGKSTNRKRP